MMKCTDCKYSVSTDYGYSNYTVEGCEIDCLLGINKEFPVDKWYNEAPSVKFAEKCNSFSEGPGVEFDVDGYITIEDYNDDIEIYELIKKWQAS